MPEKLNSVILLLVVAAIVVFIVGCSTRVGDTNLQVKEHCYDGVVYIEKEGYDNLSVKFNPDSTVATTLFDGTKCRN